MSYRYLHKHLVLYSGTDFDLFIKFLYLGYVTKTLLLNLMNICYFSCLIEKIYSLQKAKNTYRTQELRFELRLWNHDWSIC